MIFQLKYYKNNLTSSFFINKHILIIFSVQDEKIPKKYLRDKKAIFPTRRIRKPMVPFHVKLQVFAKE